MSDFALYTSIYTVGGDGAKEQYRIFLEYSRMFYRKFRIFNRNFYREVLPGGNFLNQLVNHNIYRYILTGILTGNFNR